MKCQDTAFGRDVLQYCAEIGADPLLVQGPGGNISWKDSETLWIKASGTWLSNALCGDIFVPVDLELLKSEIAKNNFKIAPKVLSNTQLRPSTETILHAIMPQRLVVHLHPVEILAYLVRTDSDQLLANIYNEVSCYSIIDYFKPGADLALAIDAELRRWPSTDIVLLKNHGVVIGGENVADVHNKLCKITRSLAIEPLLRTFEYLMIPNPPEISGCEYSAVDDLSIQQLALQPILFRRLQNDWALYPDHIVFLGPRAHTYETWNQFEDESRHPRRSPELVFVAGEGVYVKKTFTSSKQLQLRCYYEILTRQSPHTSLSTLTSAQIAELLNWDAEKYRQKIENHPPFLL